MIKKKYFHILILLLCIVALPLSLQAFWNTTNDFSEKISLESCLKKCSTCDKKITQEWQKLNILLKKINEDELIKIFFKKIIDYKVIIEEHENTYNIEYLNESISLLTALEDYNNSIMQPILLKKIDTLLPITKHQNYDPFTRLLLQQRVYLLEMSDEFCNVYSLKKQIDAVKKRLEEQYIVIKNESKNVDLYKELEQDHMQYLLNPLIIELKKRLEIVWNMYLEKESKLLKQKDFQKYLYEQKNSLELQNHT